MFAHVFHIFIYINIYIIYNIYTYKIYIYIIYVIYKIFYVIQIYAWLYNLKVWLLCIIFICFMFLFIWLVVFILPKFNCYKITNVFNMLDTLLTSTVHAFKVIWKIKVQINLISSARGPWHLSLYWKQISNSFSDSQPKHFFSILNILQ